MKGVLWTVVATLIVAAAFVGGRASARPESEQCGNAPASLRGDYAKIVALSDITRHGTDPMLRGKWTLRFRGCGFTLRHRGQLTDEGSFNVSMASTRVRGAISFGGDRRCALRGQLNHYSYE